MRTEPSPLPVTCNSLLLPFNVKLRPVASSPKMNGVSNKRIFRGLHNNFSRLYGASLDFPLKYDLHSKCSWLKQKKRSFNSIIRAAFQIELVPCLKDNYAYLIHDKEAGVIGVIDPSASEPVVRALKKKDLQLTYILNTHHHWDHTGGNVELKSRFGAKVIGPYIDRDRIPGIDVTLRDGETWMFGKHKMLVIETPGHTRGHACFFFPDSKVIFTGDTLFSLSCGRLFEGTPEQMSTSLSKLTSVPDDTEVYCGHEYTLSNAEFSLTLEPSNQALKSYYEKIKELRQVGLPTIPTNIALEKACNPFLRLSSAEIRKTLGISPDASHVQALAAVRTAKDKW